MRFYLAAAALAGALAASAGPAHGAQFVLFDAKFTYTKMDADTATPNKSHYYITSQNKDNPINPARPTNWLTYKEEGVIEHDEAMTTWWNNTAIDWTQGIRQVDLIMKDFGTGNGGNYTHLRPDPEHFFPTTMRITVIQVSKGSTYDPSLVPLPPPGADGGVVADAPPVIDGGSDQTRAGSGGAGGADGSGGVSGTGGASPSSGSGGSPPAAGTGGQGGKGGAPGASGGGVSSGCSTAPAGAPSGLALVGALLALARVRRRRA